MYDEGIRCSGFMFRDKFISQAMLLLLCIYSAESGWARPL
jgi:hypothetical protein